MQETRRAAPFAGR